VSPANLTTHRAFMQGSNNVLFRWLSLLCLRLLVPAEVRGSLQEIAPRKAAENTVKHRDSGVGSVVANHRCGSETSVVVTTLIFTIADLLDKLQNAHMANIPTLHKDTQHQLYAHKILKSQENLL